MVRFRSHDTVLILKRQELAITQIYRCAGYFRDGEVI